MLLSHKWHAIDKSGNTQRAGCTLMHSCTIITKPDILRLLVNQILTSILYFCWPVMVFAMKSYFIASTVNKLKSSSYIQK